MGRRRQPGAAPTVNTPSASPAITPAQEVPWLAPGMYISAGSASISVCVISRELRIYPQEANFPGELKSGWFNLHPSSVTPITTSWLPKLSNAFHASSQLAQDLVSYNGFIKRLCRCHCLE